MRNTYDLSIPIQYSSFIDKYNLSYENLCFHYYEKNSTRVKIKKENIVLKNILVIFNTVLKISQRKGFHAMSMRDLSKSSGLSMGALYSYFSSKDEIVKALFDEGHYLINLIFTDLFKQNLNNWEKLKYFVAMHLYLSEKFQKIFYFFYMETKSLNSTDQKKFLEMESKTENLIHLILEDGIQKSEFHLDDPLLMSGLLKSLLQDWYLKRYKFLKRNVTIEDYILFIYKLMCHLTQN
jgi:TetR/AcrR family transcriptional regulator, cholesterol catabolism regulator